MVHQKLPALSSKGCCIASSVGSKKLHRLVEISSFFSSASASQSNNPSTSRPKFALPSYIGQSQPVPKTTLPSTPPPHHPQQDHAMQQHQHNLADAIRPSYQSQTPLLLPNLLSNCDAIYFWRSSDYWRAAVGEDTPVEVEVGKSYNSGNRVTLRFGDYLDYLALGVEQEDKDYEKQQQQGGGSQQQGKDIEEQQQAEQEVAYLAQNELFPRVLNDIPIPNFCESDKYNVGEGQLYHTMLWMGPRHTVSPLALGVEQEDKDYEKEQQQGVSQQEGGEVGEQQQTEEEVAYLAQNELFPRVLSDIPIPNFCESDEYNVGEGQLYHTMLWMGPRHTVSPLHFDPLDNLLMQVVGWKRVLLFPPDKLHESGDVEEDSQQNNQLLGSNEQPTWHYAGTNGNQYNTSAVDIENPNHKEFPNFKELAPIPYECVLGPGDALYIPKRWWHHVRSLEMSVSANVWWR
eukprot:CAMPEP_0183743986 /NCGR_PEP_ID=MMETSP0737-20130205/65502_1 /TAXON_ID=385413 /ORGANISM="Thalassiosira miniscula, Strain CCMP1093" /LENGTH=458 /DNA_ID=CAMNT_0025979621 /DNA_START=80 /DNA_END=1456 /DNA_ORIENTATION=-